MKKSLLVRTRFIASLTLLAACFVLASCNTENANRPQGKRIGTWMAYQQQQKALWTGTKQMPPMAGRAFMAKTDTTANPDSMAVEGVYLSSPKGLSLTMFYNISQNLAHFSVVDSTFQNDLDVKITYKIGYKTHPCTRAGDTQYLTTGFPFQHEIKCDSSYANSENITLGYYHYNKPDTVYLKKITLNTTGLYAAAKYLEGCH